MSCIQKLFTFILPASWAASMERESRRWKAVCICGNKVSIWELGGTCWKAFGKRQRLIKCPKCGKFCLMPIVFRDSD